MKKWIILCACLWIGIAYGQKPFDLRTGDVLFQSNKARTSFVRAIVSVTTSLDDLDFSHVGVAYEENGKRYVLEAISKGVSKTPWEEFLKQSALVDGNPLVVVGRLKARYRKTIPAAIEKMKSLIGKPYDFVFDAENDAYYCSELIWLAFRKPDGSPVFPASPMTFKDKETGETSPLWLNYFKKRNVRVPEGKPGTSPGEMSRSKALKIVHRYF